MNPRLALLDETISVLESRVSLALSELSALQGMLRDARAERAEITRPFDRKEYRRIHDKGRAR